MMRSRITLSVSAALLLGLTSLTGCGASHSANGKVQTNAVRKAGDGRVNVNSTRGGVMANSYDKMEVSEDLADRIAALPEVRTANVMLVGKTAYVAVTLHDASGGLQTKSTHKVRPYSYGSMTGNGTSGMITGSGRPFGAMDTGLAGRGTVAGVPGMTGNGGSMAGVPKSLTGTGMVGGTGVARPEAYSGNGGNGIMSRSNMTDGTQLKRDIDTSMNRTDGSRGIAPYSYNMTSDTTNGDVTQAVKDKIADTVKKNHSGIDNVYVSANPDFVERADYYAKEFRAGHPLKGFAKEFGTMVERIFPTRSGY